MNRAGFIISRRSQAGLGGYPGGSPEGAGGMSDDKLMDCIRETVYENRYPTGLKIKATRGGLIAFDFTGICGFLSPEEVDVRKKKDESWSLARLNARVPIGDAFNAYLACLNGALKKSGKIRELECVHNNRLTEVSASLEPIYTIQYPLEDMRRRHEVISVEHIKSAADSLEVLLNHKDQDVIKLISLYNWAVASLGQLDFARSLITSWAIVERLMNVIWGQFILQNSENSPSRTLSPPTSGKRAEKLKANTMTAAIRIEILAIANLLTEHEYKYIEQSRKARNHWIHSLDDVTFDEAMYTAYVAALLIKRLYAVTLQTKYEAFGSWSS